MCMPIFNSKGENIDLEPAIYYMDAELLKAALVEYPFPDCQGFYDEYCRLHLEKFGKPFVFEEEQ